MRPSEHATPVVMTRTDPIVDHFAGVGAALQTRRIASTCMDHPAPGGKIGAGVGAVLVHNTECSLSRYAIRRAAQAGASSILMMDGIVEWRNTFVNAAAGDRFLRPAHADVVLCAGPLDQRLLLALGNNAQATGLPRIDAGLIRPATRPGHHEQPERPRGVGRPRVLIATARNPVFCADDRGRLLAALDQLREGAVVAGVELVWRIGASLGAALGVEIDETPLLTCLARVDAAITSPSTLMIEAMAAGVPTGLLHPHPTPLWQPATWLYVGPSGEANRRAAERTDWRRFEGMSERQIESLRQIAEEAAERSTRFGDAAEMMASMLARGRMDLEHQRGLLGLFHAQAGTAASNVADAVSAQLRTPARSGATALMEDAWACESWPERRFRRLERLAARRSGEGGSGGGGGAGGAGGRGETPARRRRAVQVVYCDSKESIERLRDCERLADEFARRASACELLTLAVAPYPDLWRAAAVPLTRGPRTVVCLLDPFDDAASRHDALIGAIEELAPDVIIADQRDSTIAASIHARSSLGAAGEMAPIVAVHLRDARPAALEIIRAYPVVDGVLASPGEGRRAADSLWAPEGRPVFTLDADDAASLERAVASLASLTPDAAPTALGMRLVEACHALASWADDPDAADAMIVSRLSRIGLRCVEPAAGPRGEAEVVMIRDETERREAVRSALDASTSEFAVYCPHLLDPTSIVDTGAPDRSPEIRAALRAAVQAGASRMVLYGAGRFARHHKHILREGFPIVGIMDDHPAGHTAFGLPTATPHDAPAVLRPDAVVLFSDQWEEVMWEKTAEFRAAGVRVVPIFGTYADPAALKVA